MSERVLDEPIIRSTKQQRTSVNQWQRKLNKKHRAAKVLQMAKTRNNKVSEIKYPSRVEGWLDICGMYSCLLLCLFIICAADVFLLTQAEPRRGFFFVRARRFFFF